MNRRNILWCLASAIAILLTKNALGMQSEQDELDQSLTFLKYHSAKMSCQQNKAVCVQLAKRLLHELTEIKTKQPKELPYAWRNMMGGKYFQRIMAFSALPNDTGIRIDVEPRTDNPPRRPRRETQLDLIIEKIAKDSSLSALTIFGDYGICTGYKIGPKN